MMLFCHVSGFVLHKSSQLLEDEVINKTQMKKNIRRAAHLSLGRDAVDAMELAQVFRVEVSGLKKYLPGND